MRVVFFGTPDFAVPTLDALLASGIDVVAVITQPDRPGARSHSTLNPPPVKVRALEAGLHVLQPDRPRGEDFYRQIRDLNPDLGVVVAYGHILKPELLAIPRLGMVNVHASLLPRWRGAAPIHWAVLSGDTETGVSIMKMDAGLDSGPVWLQRSILITQSATTGQLFGSLARLGADALLEALPQIECGDQPVPQQQSLVTLAPKVDRAMARIDWHKSSAETDRLVRAMDPAPGAWTTWRDSPLKLFGSRVSSDAPPEQSGTVRQAGDATMVACADGWITVETVQPAGRPRIRSTDWMRGHLSEPLIRFE